MGVGLGGGDRLVYSVDEHGNRIPDFSYCGYAAGEEPIPQVPVVLVVSPQQGDNTAYLQAALDHVAARAPDARGQRGAILLLRGRYEVAGQLRMSTSGVVIRGQGMDEQGTVLVGTGTDRRPLIYVQGRNDRVLTTNVAWTIVDAYVPVGAVCATLRSTEGLCAGQRIWIVRPSSQLWIERLGMQELGGGVGARWKPGSRDIGWERTLVSVDGSRVSWDVPLTTALEAELGVSWLAVVDWPGRIRQVGVENLRLESAHDVSRPMDEDHAWHGIVMEAVEDAWVRRVTFRHFCGGAVLLTETTRRVTVQECVALDPISELGGHRRETFFTAGQQTLFLQCYSKAGRHDFAVGHCAAGPNAFVQCEAVEAVGDSGPLESWASGVLYDQVVVDGGGLGFALLSGNHRGVGWTAANSVLWNCAASVIRCWSPPGARNWAYGCWGAFEGNGEWRQSNEFVRPDSLWLAQTRERVGTSAVARIRWRPMPRAEATNPTLEQAREWSQISHQPASSLRDWIVKVAVDDPLECQPGTAPHWQLSTASSFEASPPSVVAAPLRIVNGWLAVGDHLLIGGVLKTAWWRGSRLPAEAPQFGPALTRFMPGRIGPGWTDRLEELVELLQRGHYAVFEHHPGLWYDRRRDDHQMTRRADGDVVAPFFEQPFARSGQGRAWDGLSQYDLTRFNPWYWDRLRSFAKLCEGRGRVLLHQHYFQHNVLEAGAHWVDFPWRSANNLNDTGFPEPPLFVGGKRIFMAEQFYDPTHPVRGPLHQRYIRQCLESLRGCSNVLHSVAAEFTGPEAFVRFWLKVIQAWSEENHIKPWVLLSAPKDIQDSILADPDLSRWIDGIDFRYWWRTSMGEFAPSGGSQLAPRQFERNWRGGRPTEEDLAEMAAEYRQRFPEKAVICDFDVAGWAWLCAGGSLPRLPATTTCELLRAVLRMRPSARSYGIGARVLEEPGRQYLVWVKDRARLVVGASGQHWEIRSLDLQTGQIMHVRKAQGGLAEEFVGPGVWWYVLRSPVAGMTDAANARTEVDTYESSK
ncbi:MAG: DUF6298 domain-containing protein [Verrucomicrobiota bacterium]|nr:DUF6298 domain-containing protein [Limisphaera sp.]MDW8381868.1 DUF6298 domain-containing protein [Verrucomicrobiota bacterium]